MQNDQKWQEFSERMAYEGNLPIAVEPFQVTHDAIVRHNERNLHILRTLSSLDERRAENGVDDDNPVMQELLRMDSKINVLLEIVDRLLLPANLLPERHAVRFNAVGVTLPESLLPSDEFLLVRLHVDTCRALPLEIPARRGQASGSENAFVYFCELSELVEDGLERFVFCHHRRKVAEARLTSGGENVPGGRYRV